MDELLTRLDSLASWQICLGVILLLLQGAIFTVFPEEIVIVVLGYLWGQGNVAFAEAFFSVLVGLLPANLAMYGIGRRLGGWLPRWIPATAVARARARLNALGTAGIVITRFTPFVRGPAYLAAGISGFGARRFFVADALASLVYVPLLLLVGKTAGIGFSRMFRPELLAVAGLFALGLLAQARTRSPNPILTPGAMGAGLDTTSEGRKGIDP
jgi:membrane protein DedA with SNARE-associated domain